MIEKEKLLKALAEYQKTHDILLLQQRLGHKHISQHWHICTGSKSRGINAEAQV